jgi:hypothetical protein
MGTDLTETTKLIPRITAREQRQLIFDWKPQGESAPAVASVANQNNTAHHAHRPIVAHKCHPFSHPSNQFNLYFQNC